jgi:hypothetical protein
MKFRKVSGAQRAPDVVLWSAGRVSARAEVLLRRAAPPRRARRARSTTLHCGLEVVGSWPIDQENDAFIAADRTGDRTSPPARGRIGQVVLKYA